MSCGTPDVEEGSLAFRLSQRYPSLKPPQKGKHKSLNLYFIGKQCWFSDDPPKLPQLKATPHQKVLGLL